MPVEQSSYAWSEIEKPENRWQDAATPDSRLALIIPPDMTLEQAEMFVRYAFNRGVMPTIIQASDEPGTNRFCMGYCGDRPSHSIAAEERARFHPHIWCLRPEEAAKFQLIDAIGWGHSIASLTGDRKPNRLVMITMEAEDDVELFLSWGPG